MGLIGGGGSILTVPILVYLFAAPPVMATAYSLLIVGVAALIAAWRYGLKGLIDYKTGLIFAIPSAFGVWIARSYLVPNLPDIIYQSDVFSINKDQFIMLLFATLMITTSLLMLRSHKMPLRDISTSPKKWNFIGFGGFSIGVVAGIVGVGGGFLIVPALNLLIGLPIKRAIATSLAIIAAQSLIGFSGDLMAGFIIDWAFASIFIGLTIAGMLTGVALSAKISEHRLKHIFGLFVLILGLLILADQISNAL